MVEGGEFCCCWEWFGGAEGQQAWAEDGKAHGYGLRLSVVVWVALSP